MVRNFTNAMRFGDSGMVIHCLTYFAIWFQATKKHNYAAETLHWIACIKKIWSPEFLKYWKDNCLINPSGKREGFMACDYLGEYVVREIKSMMHNNINEKTNDFLWNSLSPLILSFRNVRKLMAAECDVPYSSTHSTRVNTKPDTCMIARIVLEGHIWELQENRTSSLKPSDLHGEGLRKLSTCTPIQKYVSKMQRLNGIILPEQESVLESTGEEEIDIERRDMDLFPEEGAGDEDGF
jgi:hypothetical protein